MTVSTAGPAGSVGLPLSGARAGAILDRFPQHLAAADPGKRLGAVIAALATGIDVLTRQVQDVRTAHRVGATPTVGDLLALAALHGLGEPVLDLVERRAAVLTTVLTAAVHPPAEPPPPLDLALLSRLLGVPTARLEALGDRLPATLDVLTRHPARMRLRQAAVLSAVAAQVRGAGTPTGLLGVAAGYLGLQVEAVTHSDDGWWHLARCSELLRLDIPATDLAPAPDVAPAPDLLGLEENPLRREDVEPGARRHGQRTRLLRGGLEDVDVTLRVLGVGLKTVRPMVVHVEAGAGVVFEGTVPDGGELRFGADGRVLLAGADVTASAWSFRGAVFADAGAELPQRDFCFTLPDGTVPGPAATFAVTAPVAGAFDRTSGLPHGGSEVGPLRLPRGQSHWTVLIRRSGTAGTDATDGPPAPRTAAGRFDESVFDPGPGEALPDCLRLGFEWDEREAFAVRVLLPRRLAAADDEAGSLLAQPLRRLLDRHRAAGVDVRVEYADPRWALGRGIARDADGDGLGVVLEGTELWPDGSPQDG